MVTGALSESVRLRCAELGGRRTRSRPAGRQLPAFQGILGRLGIAPTEAAFIGDDFPDMSVLRVVGLPVSVANAVPEVRDACRVRLTRSGGRGAVREFAELLLRGRGEWESLCERYVAERSRVAEHATP